MHVTTCVQFAELHLSCSYQEGVASMLPEMSAVYDPPQPDDVALLLHTSGTTSRPKGVPLRHKNLTAGIENVINAYALGPEDVSLLAMPLFHIHGIIAGMPVRTQPTHECTNASYDCQYHCTLHVLYSAWLLIPDLQVCLHS